MMSMILLPLLAAFSHVQEGTHWQSAFCVDTVLVDGSQPGDFGRAPILQVGPGRHLLVDFPEVRTAFGPAGGGPAQIVFPLLEQQGLELKAAYIVTRPWKADQANWREAMPNVRWQRAGGLGEQDARPLTGVSIALAGDSLIIQGLQAAVGVLTDPARPAYGFLFEFNGKATLGSADHPLEPSPALLVQAPVGNAKFAPPFVAQLVTEGETRTWSVTWPAATVATRLRILKGTALQQEVAFDESTKVARFQAPLTAPDEAWTLQIVGDGGAGDPPTAPFYPGAVAFEGLPASPAALDYLNRAVLPLQRTALHPFGTTARVAPTSASAVGGGETPASAIEALAKVLKDEATGIPRDMRSDALYPQAFAQPAPGYWWPDDGLLRMPRVNIVPAAWMVPLEVATLRRVNNEFDPREGPSTILIDVKNAAGMGVKGAEVAILGADGSVLAEAKTAPRSGLAPLSSAEPFLKRSPTGLSVRVRRGSNEVVEPISADWVRYLTGVAGRRAIPLEVRAMLSDVPVDWSANVLPTAAADVTEKIGQMFIGVPFNPPLLAHGYEGLLPSNQSAFKVVEWTFDLGRDRRVGGLTAEDTAGIMRLEVLTRRTGEQGDPRRWFRDPHPDQRKRWAADNVTVRFLTIRALVQENVTRDAIGWKLHPVQQ